MCRYVKYRYNKSLNLDVNKNSCPAAFEYKFDARFVAVTECFCTNASGFPQKSTVLQDTLKKHQRTPLHCSNFFFFFLLFLCFSKKIKNPTPFKDTEIIIFLKF